MQPSQARAPAIAATAIALALVNVGLAGLIAVAVGAHSIFPLWAAVVLLLLGLVATAMTVLLWRAYLRRSRY
jgi:membrane protein YdbS with pleckstrin-like domain